MSSYKRFDGFWWFIMFISFLISLIMSIKHNDNFNAIFSLIFSFIAGYGLFWKIRKWFKEPD